jgi:hypothetical protein
MANFPRFWSNNQMIARKRCLRSFNSFNIWTILMQEKIKEIPTSIPSSSERHFYPEANDHLGALDQPFVDPNSQVVLLL